jgi:hypothetical protein
MVRYLAEQMILKITLMDSEPKIWRRVEAHSGLTLHDLHYVIQCVFNWEDARLYQFHVTPGGKLTQRANARGGAVSRRADANVLRCARNAASSKLSRILHPKRFVYFE